MSTSKKMDYVVLGMLKHKSLTGYELKKCFDASIGMFWSASFGSIYPTLAALEKNEMIVRKQNESNKTQRETITYSITKKGLDYLDEWLDVPVDKDEMRCETLLKIFFCSPMDTATATAHVARYEDNIRTELLTMNKALNSLKNCDDDNHVYIKLSAEYGISLYQMLLDWCTHAKDEITKLENKRKGN